MKNTTAKKHYDDENETDSPKNKRHSESDASQTDERSTSLKNREDLPENVAAREKEAADKQRKDIENTDPDAQLAGRVQTYRDHTNMTDDAKQAAFTPKEIWEPKLVPNHAKMKEREHVMAENERHENERKDITEKLQARDEARVKERDEKMKELNGTPQKRESITA